MRLHRGRRDAMRVLHDQRGEAGGSACSRVARVVALKKIYCSQSAQQYKELAGCFTHSKIS
jgi:hypothetical protein